MSLAQAFQKWLSQIDSLRAQRAERAHPPDPASAPEGSARCAGSARQNTDRLPPAAARWSSNAVEHYLERMAIAAELGMDTSPGALADQVSCREAERVAACVPISVWPSERSRLVMDAVMDAFRDIGVSYVGLLPDDPEGGTP